ncbi:hypothetical protein [Roseateles sp.]
MQAPQPLAASPVAMAVREGAPQPETRSGAALRTSLLAASCIG